MLLAYREEPSFQDKLSLKKHCSLGSDSKKAVNRGVLDIYAYCSISNSTVQFVRPLDVFLLFLGRFFFIIFYFHGTRQTEPFVLHYFKRLAEADFYQL